MTETYEVEHEDEDEDERGGGQSQDGPPLFKLYYKNNHLGALGAQKLLAAPRASRPIQSQDGPPLFKVY